MAQRWAEMAGASNAASLRERGSETEPPARCSRSPIRTASPRTAATAAPSCSPMAAAPTSIRRRRWRASRSSPSPKSSAAPRRAASCWRRRSRLDEIEARFADRIEARDEVTVDAATLSLRARRLRRLGAITLAERPVPVAADEAARRHARRRHRQGRPRPPALDQGAGSNGATGSMFLRRAEGEEWPDLSDAGLARERRRLAGAGALRQDRARRSSAPTSSATPLAGLLPYALRRRLDAEAPTHFAAPSGSQVPIDYDGRGRTEAVDPGAGTVRPRQPSDDRAAAACRW